MPILVKIVQRVLGWRGTEPFTTT